MTDSYYMLITERGSSSLQESVNNAMEAGFIPIGGPVYDNGDWTQAVVHRKKQEENRAKPLADRICFACGKKKAVFHTPSGIDYYSRCSDCEDKAKS